MFTPEDPGGTAAGSGGDGTGPTTATIAISRSGVAAAMGSVSAQNPDLVCPDACTATVNLGTTVTLAATAMAGTVFSGWTGGGCSGTGGCSFKVTRDTTIDAAFDVASFTVDVTLPGGGTGTVTSNVGNVLCPGTCTVTVPFNTTIALTAAATANSTFLGWGGACSGTGACSFTVMANTTVSAAFATNNELDVTRNGNGTGTVTSAPAGIACGADCSRSYAPGTMVTLSAAPAGDSLFSGWSGGGCAGTGTCTVTVAHAVLITATFVLQQHPLQVVHSGNGTVTSDPGGISCGTDCSKAYDAHTRVTLTATPAADSLFAGWTGGDCTGTGTCTVTMDTAVSVTASFVLQARLLQVARDGTGSGTVTSSPAGISCGSDCMEAYDAHTVVTLTVVQAADSLFTGWTGGGCSGVGSCTVTMDAALLVTATFTRKRFLLTVTEDGNGSGTVTSSPAGISCGADCTETYDASTVVTLTAAPAADSSFTGWTGGGCSGSGTCTVTMNAAVTVTASFALNQLVLTVAKSGTGSGTVTSNPAGISCGTACSKPYDPGTMVTLTASADASSTFDGWTGGGCSGTGTCTVTMTAPTSVTATFTPRTAQLYVSNFTSTAGIEVFATGASGNIAPLRTIAGAATTFVEPRGMAVVDNEIFVVDEASAIDVFPATGVGNLAPTRKIAGAATLLSAPIGLTVFNGEIYVAQASGTILVFSAGATGNVAPSRTMSGFSEVFYIAISNGEIYATDFGLGRVVVFPVGSSGTITPTRTISGTTTGLTRPDGIVISNGEIFVSELSTNQIRVFPQAANGDAAPLRVIGGPTNSQMLFPEQMAIFGGELYVSCANSQNITVFPVGANGDVVPSRRIVGAATGLNLPLGLFIF